MTIDLINALANEQSRIYYALCRQLHDRAPLLRRLKEIRRDLADLWDARRGEMVTKYGSVDAQPNNGEAYRVGYVSWHRHTSSKRGG